MTLRKRICVAAITMIVLLAAGWVFLATPAHAQTMSTTTGSASSCGAYVTGFIAPGGNNNPQQVMHLQAFLDQFEGASLTQSGVYDAATIQATEAFQTKYASDILTPWGISQPTGVVYLTTRREINEMYCHGIQTFPLTAAQQATIAAAKMRMQDSGTSMSPSAASSGSGTTATDRENAIGASIEEALNGTSSVWATSSTSSVTNNPLDTLGSFFSKLFGR